MNTPPILLGCAALLWGWQSEQILIAVAAAVALEAPRVASRRWIFERADLHRISDLCLLLTIGLAVWFYSNYGNPRAVVMVFQWLPFALMPLALALAWSPAKTVNLGVLFPALRRQKHPPPSDLNAGHPYFVIWLLAASAADLRNSWFYPVLAAMVAWPMALDRPRGRAFGGWAAMFLFAGSIGYAGHIGLSALQSWVTNEATDWLVGSGSRTDPYRNSTDIGTIGKLKLSDAIILRLSAGGYGAQPVLLHRTSYDQYASGSWLARNGRFGGVAVGAGGSTWTLAAHPPLEHVRVYEYSAGNNPLLSLPAGTVEVRNLDAAALKRNPLGALQAERNSGFYSYDVGLNPMAQDEGDSGAEDLKLPSAEQVMLREVASQIGLSGLDPDAVGRRLSEWFASEFSYSIYQEKTGRDLTPLATFLLKTRTGHCEHFATATVLLARAAGVPARYATGFVAQEFSARQQVYIVRERHAHAWARLHVGGHWRDVDTTPAAWFSMEEARAPVWAPLYDALSALRFAVLKWLAATRDGGLKLAVFAGFAAFIAWFVWRMLAGRSRVFARQCDVRAVSPSRPGIDSEFYQVEARLVALGYPRARHEPVSIWAGQFTDLAELDPQAIDRIAALHTRLRFDPDGLDQTDRHALRQQALDWLTRHQAPTA